MTPSNEAILALFKDKGAILEGHFLLTSGLHSPFYLQCARVLCHPEAAEILGRGLADLVRGHGIQAVISPAIGGIVVGHEVARALGVRAIFAERERGRMTVRRGFEVGPGERFLVVEDVFTTGGSIMEVAGAVRSLGGEPVAAAAVVMRGRDPSVLGIPFAHLLRLEVPAWAPEECPLCREGAGAPVKPGSRGDY